MKQANTRLVEAIRKFRTDIRDGPAHRRLEPCELLPLIDQIRDEIGTLTFADVEAILGKDVAKRRCASLSGRPDARHRVLRDFIVELSAQLASDWLFFYRLGAIAPYRRGMMDLIRFLFRFKNAYTFRGMVPFIGPAVTEAARRNDVGFITSLYEALTESKQRGLKCTLQNSRKRGPVVVAEILVRHWVSLDGFQATLRHPWWDGLPEKKFGMRRDLDVTFSNIDHHGPIGLCHFSHEALNNFFRLVLPDCKSDAAKVRTRELGGLVQYSQQPLVTEVFLRGRTIHCS